MEQQNLIDNEYSEPFSKDWKLLITYGSPRTVHARGCDYIKDWSIYGTEELGKLKPEKHHICPICAGLCYTSLGAKDFVENLSMYKKLFLSNIFGGVDADVLKSFYYTYKAKTFVHGNKLFIHLKQDDWYIDTSLNGVRLFHNNYRVGNRERGKDYDESGYHEHKLPRGEKKPLMEAIKLIIRYDFDKAAKSHKKKRDKRPRMTFSEYDPESWGFTDS